MEVVAKINKELLNIRKELADVDAGKQFPRPFNPLTDELPAEIEKLFDALIAAGKAGDEDAMLDASHQIEDYFNFPKPNELVKNAQVPGGMYTNMVAQLKALKSEDILEDAMKLIPQVRLDAGLPPLVTPTSQIVGAQAVNCALDLKNGKQMYTNVSNQFKSLVKGDYGKTPIAVNPDFREKICGFRDERPFDTSSYKMQPNPLLKEYGNVKLAENEEEVLLLELFPLVAKNYLTNVKKTAWEATHASHKSADHAATGEAKKVVGKKVTTPLPGRLIHYTVKPGDQVKDGQTIAVVEAMKMENNITTDFSGYVNNLFAEEGDTLPADAVLLDVVKEPVDTTVTAQSAPKAVGPTKAVTVPMPGRIIDITVKPGDQVKSGQTILILESMKMENSITSEYSGVVNEIFVNVGDTVPTDTKVLDLIKK